MNKDLLLILIIVDAALLAILVAIMIIKSLCCGKKKKEEPAPIVIPAPPQKPAEPIKVEFVNPVKIDMPKVEKVEKVEKIEEPVEEEDEEDEDEISIGDSKKKLSIKRVPFYQKMLLADKETQTMYDSIYNTFLGYKGVHARPSSKCASFRFGRELIAKISYRGKTMKLHLALKLNKFDESRYFQKDMSDTKAYIDVPFTVKVKSARALARAFELIEALATNKKIEKKKRFEPIDSIELLKSKI